MTVHRSRLRELADQAVRDIVELDEQVAAGEIPSRTARALRQRYEVLAAQALRDLDVTDEPAGRRGAGPIRPRTWTTVYGLAGVTALVAVLVLLPDSVLTRPSSSFATGNEVLSAAAAGPVDPTRSVTDAQLEQVVAANPGVVGVRLALADRYVAEGRYSPAMRHYLDALDREPRNPEALAHLGWLLWQIRQDGPAWDSVNQALAISPTLQDALWFRAVIALYGRDDPATALSTVQQVAAGGMSPEMATQVQQLTDAARAREKEKR